MYMEEPSRGTALFKHLDAHVSASKVRLSSVIAGSLAAVALILWLTPRHQRWLSPREGTGTWEDLAFLLGRRQRSSHRPVRFPSSLRRSRAAGAAPFRVLPEEAARA